MAQTIAVPDELYERLQREAAAARVPIEDVATRALVTGLPPSLDDIPARYRTALRHLETLPDSDLWKVLREQFPAASAARQADLLERNSQGALSPAERAELRRLSDAANRLMLRRAHAAALLRWRGHTVPFPRA
jgi:hypothetical protein